MGKLPTRDEAEARYAHGTFARYKLAACMCLPCRLAGSRWREEHRTRYLPPWRLHFARRGQQYVVRNRYDGTIDSRYPDRASAQARVRKLNDGHTPTVEQTRRHVRRLRAQGMGLRAIAESAGVSRTTLQALMKGSQRTNRPTMNRVLGVPVKRRLGALVDAGPTWELIRCLVDAGWTRHAISRGIGNRDRHLQIGRQRCRARTAGRVRWLHDAEWRRDGAMRERCPHVRP